MQKYCFYLEIHYICFKIYVNRQSKGMEKLLHYVWKHRILPFKTLLTLDKRMVEVIDPGTHNTHQGPDFFNAKVKLNGILWAGNVEIHLKASDWYHHGHHLDAAYNNTILHVVLDADKEAETQDGHKPVTIQVDMPKELLLHYRELCTNDDYPRCHRIVSSIPSIKTNGWMDALLVERMEARAGKVAERARRMNGDWEKAAFVTLSRNFGFGLNGDIYEMWAQKIPLQAAAKHRDNLFQIQSLFMGMANLIDPALQAEGWDTEKAQREYAFLAHKFQLPEPVPRELWKFMRTRPSNFPHLRILQLARIYVSGKAGLHNLLEVSDIKELHNCLHEGSLSAASRNLIIINTVIPLLYAYGIHLQDQGLKDKATDLLAQLPPENNFIIRQWKGCGLSVRSAADSQALIQLKREYCDRADCLRCRFGYEYLKQ